MHIGRATTVPPEQTQHHASEVRATLDLTRTSPVVIAHASAPTGDIGSAPATYNPVTDLIARHTQVAQAISSAIPPHKRSPEETYAGTPPPPSIIDLTA